MKFSVYRFKAITWKVLIAASVLTFLMAIRNVYFPTEQQTKTSSDNIRLTKPDHTNVFNIASEVSKALQKLNGTNEDNAIETDHKIDAKETHETTAEERSESQPTAENKVKSVPTAYNPDWNKIIGQNNQDAKHLLAEKYALFHKAFGHKDDGSPNRNRGENEVFTPNIHVESMAKPSQSGGGGPDTVVSEDFIFDEELNFRNKSTSKVYSHGHDYPNKELCPNEGEGIEAIIIIPTALYLRRRRDPIRKTWGKADKDGKIVVAFLSGKPSSEARAADLQNEMDEFGDIIIDNLEDSYMNLPLKIISIFEWAGLYCSKATYVMKADDDVFVNIEILKEFIEEHKERTDTIFGRYIRSPWPTRITSRKFYVSREEYPSGSYPAYVTGPSYLVPAQAAKEIYDKALTMPYFRFEDIFLMGMVAEKLHIKREHSHKFCLARSLEPKPCYANQCIAVHNVKDNLQLAFWESMMNKVQC